MKRYGYNPIKPTTRFDLWLKVVELYSDEAIRIITWIVSIWAIGFIFTALGILMNHIF